MIMRAFVKLRQMLETNEELNRKFAAVVRKLSTHDKYFKVVFDELKKLAELPTPARKQIGLVASGNHRDDAHAFYESLGYSFTGRRYKRAVAIGRGRT